MSGVPDAWDDDWVDTIKTAGKPKAEVGAGTAAPKLTKAERRAQHLEQQKQLWDSADSPGRNLWLEAQGAVVPNRQEIKPQVTLLSRKPPPRPQIAKRDASVAGTTGGIGQLSLQDQDEEEDSEEEARRKHATEMEERQRRAKIEYEEKQRRYAEARQRIMGSSSSQQSSAATSQESLQQQQQQQKKDHPARRGARNSNNNNISGARHTVQSGSPVAVAERSLSNNSRKELFDPDDAGNGGRRPTPRREGTSTPKEEQPVRQPRGPQNVGRGGFGFAAAGKQRPGT